MLTRAHVVRWTLALTTFGLASVGGGAFLQAHRHGALLEATASAAAPSASRSADDAGAPPASPPRVPTEPPTFEAIDFVEEQGGIFSIPYDRLAALALNAPRTVAVIEGALYQAIIEGDRLEPVYRQIQKRRINRLEASSFANGETYLLPVVPMTTLMQGRGPLGIPAPPHPTLVPCDGPGDEVPVITRIRIVLQEPYHFDGKTGAYRSDGGR